MRLLPNNKEMGFVPYFWLVYLLNILVYLPLQGAGRTAWVLSILGIVIFIPFYFAAHWVRGNRLLVLIALFALLGILLSPINLGASVYFVYAAAFWRSKTSAFRRGHHRRAGGGYRSGDAVLPSVRVFLDSRHPVYDHHRRG
jgi:hypothetical protein